MGENALPGVTATTPPFLWYATARYYFPVFQRAEVGYLLNNRFPVCRSRPALLSGEGVGKGGITPMLIPVCLKRRSKGRWLAFMTKAIPSQPLKCDPWYVLPILIYVCPSRLITYACDHEGVGGGGQKGYL